MIQERLVGLIQRLVSYPSVTHDLSELHKIIDYVASLFSKYPQVVIEKHMYDGYPCLVVQNFAGKHADIALCGHFDVVPPSEEGQFDTYIKDDRIYGRGAGDMKDGCAIIISLMQELLADGYMDKKISLWCTCDEEIGGAHGIASLVADGYTTDVALIPDSGSLTEVTIATKGIFTMWLCVRGHAAHSSRPWEGINALEKAYMLYQDIKQAIEEPEKLVEEHLWRGTTVQLTECAGGVAMNVVPGEAYITINIRHTETYTEDTLYTIIHDIVATYDADILDRRYGALMVTSEQHPSIQQYKHIAEEVIGQPVCINKEHGSTDGAHLPHSTVVILHQPTDANIHSKDEYTHINELENIYNIYKQFILMD